MKITEAENVSTRYKSMITLLELENESRNSQVTTMQKKIIHEAQEITRMQSVLREASKARTISKKALAQVNTKKDVLSQNWFFCSNEKNNSFLIQILKQ